MCQKRLNKVGNIPNLLDNKEVFLHACATVAFALRAVADAVRTRTEKLPYYRVHSVMREHGALLVYGSFDGALLVPNYLLSHSNEPYLIDGLCTR
jgi:hypothetical protein